MPPLFLLAVLAVKKSPSIGMTSTEPHGDGGGLVDSFFLVLGMVPAQGSSIEKNNVVETTAGTMAPRQVAGR